MEGKTLIKKDRGIAFTINQTFCHDREKSIIKPNWIMQSVIDLDKEQKGCKSDKKKFCDVTRVDHGICLEMLILPLLERRKGIEFISSQSLPNFQYEVTLSNIRFWSFSKIQLNLFCPEILEIILPNKKSDKY